MFIIESMWFFLPILAANQCPGLAAYFNLPFSHTPILRRWLGENKTIAAYYVAPIGSTATIYLQQQCGGWSKLIGLFDYNHGDLWLIGISLGIGAVLGDHIKSFIKRRAGIPPGDRWWPFDQLDFVFGGVLLALPLVGWIGWDRLLVICLFVLLIHPIGNRIGYYLGLRRVPW